MTDCSTCGYPMAWSITHQRARCSVYGDHPAPTPSLLLLRADDENTAFEVGARRRYQFRAVA